MNRILITGAGGNVGSAIIKNFSSDDSKIYLSSRSQNNLKESEVYFDFEDFNSFEPALKNCDTLFLLRPPQISDVKKYFEPLIEVCVQTKIKHIVFLSVQGAESVKFIPHAKIEKLILESGIPYTFIRPSYFMQNLSTTLLKDIQENNLIFLPAGKAPFLWIDVNDIGKAIARILEKPNAHINKAYTITGKELFNFFEVAEILSDILKRNIKYENPGLIRFYLEMRKKGTPSSFIFVMIMLHYLARFQKAPAITNDFKMLTGEEPNDLRKFIEENKFIF